MERGTLVTKTMLTGGKFAEILGSFRDSFIVKFENNPSGRF